MSPQPGHSGQLNPSPAPSILLAPLLRCLLVAVLAGWCTAQAGRLVVSYQNSETYHLYSLYFSALDVLKEWADPINDAIDFPVDVPVKVQECGFANAFYTPEDQQLVICYELLQEFYDLTAKDDPGEAFTHSLEALSFVFYHELGHALIDLWQLPIVGREEDVADQFAVMVLSNWDTEHLHMVLEGADMFYRYSRETPAGSLDLWDEHSLDGQRYANFLCWAYGSNPSEYRIYLELSILSERRKDRCEKEYRQLMYGWSALLASHLKGVH